MRGYRPRPSSQPPTRPRTLAGTAATGALIDRHLRALTLASCGLLALAAIVIAAALISSTAWPVHAAAVIWGLGFGGAATLLQTAVADAADLAQSLLVTCWNLGIATAAAAGGLLLDHGGPESLPWSALALLALALAVAAAAPAARASRAGMGRARVTPVRVKSRRGARLPARRTSAWTA
ncbi:hypothetical protein [Kitasatospora sp. NPDC056531]|uniref:hypothetical protein n=1 Tax=Kitasatospora sp. NPDC056531 TaxID=3345856 RepID=UPI00369056F8